MVTTHGSGNPPQAGVEYTVLSFQPTTGENRGAMKEHVGGVQVEVEIGCPRPSHGPEDG